MSKTLSELLEAVEPDIIYHTTGDLVHCADYERMRGVAIELAKACEIASSANSYHDVGPTIERGCYSAKAAIRRAKDIIGGE